MLVEWLIKKSPPGIKFKKFWLLENKQYKDTFHKYQLDRQHLKSEKNQWMFCYNIQLQIVMVYARKKAPRTWLAAPQKAERRWYLRCKKSAGLNAGNRTCWFIPQVCETGSASRKQEHFNLTRRSAVSMLVWAAKKKGAHRTWHTGTQKTACFNECRSVKLWNSPVSRT